jgi:hypothetical protein
MLPFRGAAWYDPDLGAWVGLYLDPHVQDTQCRKTTICNDANYRLCVSRVTSSCGQPPEWKKVSIQDLSVFDAEEMPWWDHGIKVQLLYMRERREYYLVEYLDNHALRLTMFWLTYGDDEELIVTAHGSARS